MAGGDGDTPTPAQASRVPATARPVPPGLVPVAALLAAAAALLALLPSLAQAVWEVPHLLLLGLVISYGVFAQRNADADRSRAVDGNGNDNGAKKGFLARNSRYRPDAPLVVVADPAASDDDDGHHQEGASERPLSLPVRRLKLAAARGPEAGDASYGVSEEAGSSASSSGFWAGARAAPSPPSVLDADVGLPDPWSPPAFVHSATKSRVFLAHHPSAPHNDQPSSVDGDATDWDEEADGSDDAAASPERPTRGEFAACADDHDDGKGDDTSVDEELFELATKPAPEGEDEVDRKADEFIAKFKEQIRLQQGRR